MSKAIGSRDRWCSTIYSPEPMSISASAAHLKDVAYCLTVVCEEVDTRSYATRWCNRHVRCRDIYDSCIYQFCKVNLVDPAGQHPTIGQVH